MRVAVACPYDLRRPGGVQQQVRGLVEGLRRRGEEAWLVGPGVPDDLGMSVGGSVVIPGNRSRSALAVGPRVAERVRRAVRGADVLHVHEPFMPLVSLAALRTPVPTVATFHAAPPRWVQRLYGVLRGAGGRLLRDAVLTAVSPTAAEAVPSAWGRPEIVPNAIDVRSYAAPVERDGTRVAFVGRDEPRKGLDVLRRAWPLVRAHHPTAELVVAGAGGEDGEGVRYRGRVTEEEKRRLLGSAGIFVAPNLGGESFGVVIVEAMAAGCAVVASDLAAFRAVAGPAAVYAPRADPAGLAACLVELLDDVEKRTRVALAGRERVGRYDWEVVLGEYLDRYRLALERATS